MNIATFFNLSLKINVQRLAEEFLAAEGFKISPKNIELQKEVIQLASNYVRFFAKWLDNLTIKKVIDNKKQKGGDKK